MCVCVQNVLKQCPYSTQFELMATCICVCSRGKGSLLLLRQSYMDRSNRPAGPSSACALCRPARRPSTACAQCAFTYIGDFRAGQAATAVAHWQKGGGGGRSCCHADQAATDACPFFAGCVVAWPALQSSREQRVVSFSVRVC